MGDLSSGTFKSQVDEAIPTEDTGPVLSRHVLMPLRTVKFGIAQANRGLCYRQDVEMKTTLRPGNSWAHFSYSNWMPIIQNPKSKNVQKSEMFYRLTIRKCYTVKLFHVGNYNILITFSRLYKVYMKQNELHIWVPWKKCVYINTATKNIWL